MLGPLQTPAVAASLTSPPREALRCRREAQVRSGYCLTVTSSWEKVILPRITLLPVFYWYHYM